MKVITNDFELNEEYLVATFKEDGRDYNSVLNEVDVRKEWAVKGAYNTTKGVIVLLDNKTKLNVSSLAHFGVRVTMELEGQEPFDFLLAMYDEDEDFEKELSKELYRQLVRFVDKVA